MSIRIAAQKKVHRFLLPSLPTGTVDEKISIHDTRIIHQIHRVLKLQPGEPIVLFVDGGPNVITTIVDSGAATLTVQINAIAQSIPLPRTVIAAVSIVKGDAFELIVQKLTELGVTTIVPLITGRTIKQTVRTERLQTISDEALEQCGGTHRVRIYKPISLEQCFNQFPYQSIILDPYADGMPTLSEGPLVFYIGPEGGWNEQDETVITAHAPLYMHITQRVLRTETAAIVAAYALLWQ